MKNNSTIMMTKKNIAKKLSDEEPDREMERIYGSDWSMEVLSLPKEPVTAEFLERMFIAKQIGDNSLMDRRFYKEHPQDKIWWVDNEGTIGEWEFSFDKKTIFNLFRDYPHKLTKEQKEVFDRENPEWREFFADRGE